MIIESSKHLKILKREYNLQNAEFLNTLETQALKLREKGELYFSQFVGIDDKRGNIILRLSVKRPLPRKGDHLAAIVPDPKFLDPKKWGGATYAMLRVKPQRICELVPIWYNFQNDNAVIIGFRGATTDFVHDMPAKMSIVLGPQDPPLEYLKNLIFLIQNGNNVRKIYEILNIDQANELWHPQQLKNDIKSVAFFKKKLESSTDIIIQGPPGTGKSFLIANICSEMLKEGKRILVTSLTNKALTEVASKEGLSEDLASSKIFKTNLTLDELKSLPKLKDFKDFRYTEGTLLLSTYYTMSKLALEAVSPRFDLVVVEEASQAFLATIAAARHLGTSIVLVGDQNQLRPIHIIKANDLDTPELIKLFYGLESVCKHFPIEDKYLLNETYRLNKETTELTNAFYEDKLISISDIDNNILIPDIENIRKDVAVQIIKMKMQVRDKLPAQPINYIKKLVIELNRINPKLSIVVLSPYVVTAKTLFKEIFPSLPNGENVLIETIDKIQGLTVDICVLFIPNTGISFCLAPNRFNVATSRATLSTFVILPDDIDMESLDRKVKLYLNRAKY